MKSILMGTIIAVAATASAPAMVWEGQKVACYDKVYVPTTYKTSKHLKHPAKKVGAS
ncbi:MAG: hypothetical protein WAO78_19515 [Roseovarius sp.]